MENQNKKYFQEAWYGRCDDASWNSNFDFFNRIGIVQNDLWLELKELFKCGIFTSIQQEGICYISRPPIFLKRDERGNMHNPDDYAIYFKDGFGLHYLNGVYFSPEDFDKYVKDKKATGSEILQIKNTEQKGALIKLYGYEKIISELKNIKVLDRLERISQITNKNTICEVIEFELDSRMICRVLKVEDHSVHKITFLGMPREKQTETCLGCLAWSFKLESGEYYKPVMES